MLKFSLDPSERLGKVRWLGSTAVPKAILGSNQKEAGSKPVRSASLRVNLTKAVHSVISHNQDFSTIKMVWIVQGVQIN